jgi:arylsulfatase
MWMPLLLALAAVLPARDDEAAPPARPNIVLIVGDDLGLGDVGCYGQEKIATPRIDALATEGLRFTRFYAAAPVCAPTRCSLMTGLHGGHAYVRDNRELAGEGQLALPSGTVTFPRLLQQAGYRTAMFGKWGLGGPGTSGEPLEHGFDEWFGYYCQRQAQTFYPAHLWRDGKRVPLAGNRRDGTGGTQYAHDLFMDEIERFLSDAAGAEDGRPFFLYLPFTLPHLALQPEQEDLEPYLGRFEERPYGGELGHLPHPTPRAAYAAMVSRLDADVGRVVDLVDAHGLARDTLVVFMSDNGPVPPMGGADTRFFDSNGALRGHKWSLYEGGIRVPFIARWPGRIAPGTSDWMGAHYDLMPTFLELAGITVPTGLDGLSFAGELLGGESPAHEFLFWEFHGDGGQQAVRIGRWKGVRRHLLTRPAPLELYDLDASARERHDVAEEHPEVVARMLALLEREHVPSREFPMLVLDASGDAGAAGAGAPAVDGGGG